MPIINRGTFMRCHSIDTIVHRFLSMKDMPNKQIISLGAGFDTRYFMIKSGMLDFGKPSIKESCKHYFELDFPENTMKKARIIKQKKIFQDLIMQHSEKQEVEDDQKDNDSNSNKNNKKHEITLERGGTELSGHDYHLIGGDLREWNEQIVDRLLHYGLDVNAPTLFISECVFIYLPPEHTTHILQWITQSMAHPLFTLYEQIRPDDSFGKVMIRNLQDQNIELKGIHAFPTLLHQENRFRDLGWDYAKAVTINTLHDSFLNSENKARISKLELLDELEEWRLLSDHYCIAWAYKSEKYNHLFNKIGLIQN
ncbi:unnamed protein product [Cunninghamella echinulata]